MDISKAEQSNSQKSCIFIKNLRKILIENNITVSKIQMTSGNYDDSSNLIDGVIPTITTNLCEIGTYSDTCYFTVIINSALFTKRLFSELIKYNNVHIYGYKNFTEDYYPKDDFKYDKFEIQIQSEHLAQIQFNLNIDDKSLLGVFEEYIKVSQLFGEARNIIVDQLRQCI